MKKTFKIIKLECKDTETNEIWLYPTKDSTSSVPYHLYVVSDEQPKNDDWMMCFAIGIQDRKTGEWKGRGHYIKKHYGDDISKLNVICVGTKKIIATTDIQITSDFSTPGELFVPSIPESFIKAYIKAYNEGKPITEVDLEMEQDKLYIKPEDLAQYESKPKELQHPHTSDSNNIWKIKTRPDNTVIVHQSKMYSREEVERFILQSHIARNKMINPFDEIPKWIDENL